MKSARVCRSCTNNPHLKDWIAVNGNGVEHCTFGCAIHEVSVDLVSFAQHVDNVIRGNFSFNDGDDVSIDDEDPEKVIVRVAGIGTPLAHSVVAIARSREGHPSFYDFRLSEAAPWPMEHGRVWSEVVEIVKSRARYFSKVRSVLDDLLGDVTTLVGGAAIRQLTAVDRLFRARRENTTDEADVVFKSPAAELRAPPHDRARAKRMNASGIRVFYGALREEIAMAEVRPPVGSRVVVGTFTPRRTLRVLDLVALRWPREYADIFSAGFDALSKKLVFLSTLQDEISRPIQPYDEELEDLPTQVISEYLANVIGLDGIAYKSAQTPAEILATGPASKNRNVALFGTAAMTTAEFDTTDIESAGLQFVEGSQHMFDVTDVRVTYEKNASAHHEPPPDDGESPRA